MLQSITRTLLVSSAMSLALVSTTDTASAQMPAVLKPDARTPISQLPFTITQSGSYYLTDTLTGVSASSGIIIDASDVTLDLNGFSLMGVVGAVDGIETTNAVDNITLLNGSVVGWPGAGIDLATATNVAIRNVTSKGNNQGFVVNQANLDSCVAIQNFSAFNASGGSVLRKCTARDNTGRGFDLFDSRLLDSTLIHAGSERGIFIHDGSCIVRGCDLTFTNGIVIWVHAGSDHVIDKNRILGAGGHSVYFHSPTQTMVTRNQIESTIRNDFGAGNKVAPTEDPMTSTNPWANLIF